MADDYPLAPGNYSRPVTGNDSSRRWFDRGLLWLYGFHKEEAVFCFEKAIDADGDCAMAYWGLATAHLPDYNFHYKNGYYVLANQEVGFPSMKVAMDTLRAAPLEKALPVERALLQATLAQCAWPLPDEAGLPGLREACAAAMRQAARDFPEDPEVLVAFAASLMVMHPWTLFQWPTAEPAPVVPELDALLTDGLRRHPKHPGLLHYRIHFQEMSPTFDLRAADELEGSFAGDAGHLHHMPSHLYIQTGDYAKAMACNERALDAHSRTLAGAPARCNFYRFYIAHDHEFLIWAALFAGRKEQALKAVYENQALIPEAFLRRGPVEAENGELFWATEVSVLLRFGEWQRLLDLDLPSDAGLFAARTALLLFGKATALATLGRVAEAKAMAERFEHARSDPNCPVRRKHNVGLPDMLDIASKMLAGEIKYREGAHAEAFELLEQAVQLDDSLAYDEPWGWLVPVRHALGALLLEQGEQERAAAVYSADLKQHPRNIWALTGLRDCMGAAAVDAESLTAAEELADVAVRASCACATQKWCCL